MIIKSFELSKFKETNFKIFLFYGKNEGLKKELINKNFLENFVGTINKYEEGDFIGNLDNITNELLTKSLFETNKIIMISRVSDKILKFIEEILEKNLVDVKIILKTGTLEKRSKLRSYFEKNKRLVVVPFYEDGENELFSIVVNFINKHNIKISRESINLLVSRASGDRENLNIELEKILSYSLSKKNINFETVQTLTNLAENYGVNELADSYLSKNKKKIAKILNENNYSEEDCVLILRTILNKSKRLMYIIENMNLSKNIDEVLSSIKPPVFWKEKENVKKQAITWELEDLKKKIYEINEVETLVKTNSKNSLNLISDFIVNH